MSETRKILVALDGSKHSEYALNCEYFLHLCGLLWGEGGRECRECTITGTHRIHLHLHEINLSFLYSNYRLKNFKLISG